MKKQFCINCGKPIQKGTKFCPYCGAKQNPSKTQSTQTNSQSTTPSRVDRLMNMKQDTQKEEAENKQKEESLSLQERTYINNKVSDEAPSTGVAYLLGIFLFDFGAPQWYLHHYIAGTIILIDTFVLSWAFGLGLVINGIWWLIDLCLYPLYIRHAKAKIKREAINNVMLIKH